MCRSHYRKHTEKKISPVFGRSVWDAPLLAYQTNQYPLSSGGRLQQEGFTIKRHIWALQLLGLLLLVPLHLLLLLVMMLLPPEHFLNLTFHRHCGFRTLTRELWTFRATVKLGTYFLHALKKAAVLRKKGVKKTHTSGDEEKLLDVHLC